VSRGKLLSLCDKVRSKLSIGGTIINSSESIIAPKEGGKKAKRKLLRRPKVGEKIFIFPDYSHRSATSTHNNMCQPKRYERKERFIYSFVRVSDMIYGNR